MTNVKIVKFYRVLGEVMYKFFLILGLLISTNSLFSLANDNFSFGSLSIGGVASASIEEDNFQNDDMTGYGFDISLILKPDFEIFIIKNISLSITPYFKYREVAYDDSDYDDQQVITSYYKYGGELGLSYYLAYFKRFVPYVGVYAYVYDLQYMDDYIGGDKIENQRSYRYLGTGLSIGALYFMTDRVAMNMSFYSTTYETKKLTNTDGSEYVYSDSYDKDDWLDSYIEFFIGISYFCPINRS